MEIDQNTINHIKEEARKMEHGKIVVQINGTSSYVDVVVEKRQRFKKESDKKRVYKKG